jgi:hypothetical protein
MREINDEPVVVPVYVDKPADPGLLLMISGLGAFAAVWVTEGLREWLRGRSSHGLKDWNSPEYWDGLTLSLFFISWAFFFVLLWYQSTRQDRLKALMEKSRKALEVSSDYLHGRGVIKSLQIADVHYIKALSGLKQVAKESTSGETCLTCAVALEKLAAPEGIVVNPATKFADWNLVAATFLRSALLGNNSAQLIIAQLYQAGAGVGRNLSEAYAWFNICAANGNLEAERSRECLATNMSQAQVLLAQKRSQALLAMVNGRE